MSGIHGIDKLDSPYPIRNSPKVHNSQRVLRFRSSVAEDSVLLARNGGSLDRRPPTALRVIVPPYSRVGWQQRRNPIMNEVLRMATYTAESTQKRHTPEPDARNTRMQDWFVSRTRSREFLEKTSKCGISKFNLFTNIKVAYDTIKRKKLLAET